MFEWLMGDPLVGLLTTVAFFVSLLVGRSLRLRRMKHTEKAEQ
jgi:hypothetical protein